MAKLQKFQAKICNTTAGVLIHEQKVLLVKHKKLGLWLAPGGHIEENELPHQAAEREFWEEAGIKVKAVDAFEKLPSTDSEYLPNPFLSNLHWISEQNYHSRINQSDKKEKNWEKGCEQHLCLIYMMKPVGSLDFKQNIEETDGIGWFTLDEVKDLETTEDIKSEVEYAFKLWHSQ